MHQVHTNVLEYIRLKPSSEGATYERKADQLTKRTKGRKIAKQTMTPAEGAWTYRRDYAGSHVRKRRPYKTVMWFLEAVVCDATAVDINLAGRLLRQTQV